MGYLRPLVLLVAFLPVFSTAGEKKKTPSPEDDLDALQGRWVQVKPEGKLKVTLVFGHKQDKDEVKNYLIVAETAISKGKEEIESGSFGRIEMKDAEGKRAFSYKKAKGGDVGYKFSEGKLILEGEYATADVKRQLTGEWKKLAESVALPEVGKAILGTWERKGIKEDPTVLLEFRIRENTTDIVEMITKPYRAKDNKLVDAHIARVNVKEQEAPGLAAIPVGSRAIWARVLTPKQMFMREEQPIYLELTNGKLRLEGDYVYKKSGTKYSMTGEWTKVEMK